MQVMQAMMTQASSNIASSAAAAGSATGSAAAAAATAATAASTTTLVVQGEAYRIASSFVHWHIAWVYVYCLAANSCLTNLACEQLPNHKHQLNQFFFAQAWWQQQQLGRPQAQLQ